ncbi:MAG: hypothetical protein PT944_02855 [Actinomycetaceae bacterium]|nr:hypothetical protein [Actinomycetaceae bacterium]
MIRTNGDDSPDQSPITQRPSAHLRVGSSSQSGSYVEMGKGKDG